MLLIFPLEVVQASFLSSLFLIWYVWIVNFRRSEEVCQIWAFVFAGVILFPFLFKKFFCGRYGISFNFFGVLQLSFGLKTHMKLNGQKWLDEMDQRNSDKSFCFWILSFWSWMTNYLFYLFTFNSIADYLNNCKNTKEQLKVE